MFFCRAANGALVAARSVTINDRMRTRSDSSLSEYRRRAQRGTRDIAIAVALTLASVALIGLAWLGNSAPSQQAIGPSAGIARP